MSDRPIRTKTLGFPVQVTGGRIRRFFGRQRNVFGRLEFREEGLFFDPYRIEQLLSGVRPQFLAKWEDIAAVDLDDSFGGDCLTLLRTDRSRQVVGGVNKHLSEDALRKLAFEPHERPSWPGHRLFTRPPAEPDWSLLDG
ncbi:MAG TPA: hypothetical protein VFA96_03125 [Nocardioides sp.]|nr:hypothetical protein [Nocardioides sp.]